MGLVFMSGFEWGTNREFDQVGGSVVTSQKRSGAYSADIGNGQWLHKTLPQPLTEVYVQFAYRSGYAFTAVSFVISKGGTDILSINKDGNYRLQVCSGYGGTVYCTGVTPLQQNVWYLIELHYRMADTGGLIELRVDGNLEATFSGDTKPGADGNFDKMRWGATTGTTVFNLDDVVIFDTSGEVNNTWPNGLKVVLLKPNADGGVNQWEPTPTGSHYACVDEVPVSGSDYLKAGSADLLEVLGLEDLPAEAQSVKAVRVDFWGLKGSIQPPQNLQLGVKIGGSDYLSPDKALPLAQGLVSHSLDQNPAGGNWSVAVVNGMQLLAKSRT
uniref:Uncharacterized protein n=1 Tax=Desulfobacca acetoxidans TaxID=60893 RepID=A0A7V4LCZ0_9BACT